MAIRQLILSGINYRVGIITKSNSSFHESYRTSCGLWCDLPWIFTLGSDLGLLRTFQKTEELAEMLTEVWEPPLCSCLRHMVATITGSSHIHLNELRGIYSNWMQLTTGVWVRKHCALRIEAGEELWKVGRMWTHCFSENPQVSYSFMIKGK